MTLLATSSAPRVDRARLSARLDGLAAMTELGPPWTRVAFSDLHLDARHGLADEMAELDVEAAVDAGGNLIGTRVGTHGPQMRHLLSGAGHDAAFMSRATPTGMIFILCRAGRSHCPEEYASAERLDTGAQVLLDTLIALATAR
jgi:acetylornithine deacetylase/succinyl-diaminopimelate desuccinylase-like protein